MGSKGCRGTLGVTVASGRHRAWERRHRRCLKGLYDSHAPAFRPSLPTALVLTARVLRSQQHEAAHRPARGSVSSRARARHVVEPLGAMPTLHRYSEHMSPAESMQWCCGHHACGTPWPHGGLLSPPMLPESLPHGSSSGRPRLRYQRSDRLGEGPYTRTHMDSTRVTVPAAVGLRHAGCHVCQGRVTTTTVLMRHVDEYKVCNSLHFAAHTVELRAEH